MSILAKGQAYTEGYYARNELGESRILALGYNRAKRQRSVTPEWLKYNELEQQGNRTSAVLLPRELQIASLVSLGKINEDIATELGISPRTARNHLANIFKKLGFTNRTEVAIWYSENYGLNNESGEELIIDNPLSDRQYEVAILVSEGLDNSAVSEKLGLSLQTVKNHITVICKKLMVKNKAQIAAWVFKNKENVE